MGKESGTWIIRGVSNNDPTCIHTMDEAIDYINEVGFLPLFKNEIPGFSLEEHTVSYYWWSEDIEHDPWEWREMIARTGKVAYGKFFANKAGFISKEWFPRFANWRRDGYDFDSLWDDEKASIKQKKIMDLFSDDTQLFSFEVKEKAGYGKNGEKNFDGTIASLQMQTYLCMRDFRQRKNKAGVGYGMDVAIYSKPEQLWGYDHIAQAYKEDPSVSASKIEEHISALYPEATPSQIKKIIGVGNTDVKIKRTSKRTGIKDWIVPANPKYYDLFTAFANSKIVEWKQSSDVHVGDIVYLYVAAPYSSIMYKCRAIEVDIPADIHDECLSIDTLMSLELIEQYDKGIWSFERIKDFGVLAVRGPRNMPIKLKKEMEKKG